MKPQHYPNLRISCFSLSAIPYDPRTIRIETPIILHCLLFRSGLVYGLLALLMLI